MGAVNKVAAMLQSTTIRQTNPQIIGEPSSASKHIMNFMCDKLTKKLTKNSLGLHSPKSYMLEHHLQKIMTAERIAVALDGRNDELIRYVCQNLQKTFAIILLSYEDPGMRIQALENLHAHDFTDDQCLPVTTCSRLHPLAKQECRHDHKLEAFHYIPGRSSNRSNFFEKQWAFCVQNFSGDGFISELDSQVILPFTRREPFDVGHGGFSEVFMAWMLRSHQSVIEQNGERELCVGVKRLRMPAKAPKGFNLEGEWRREAKAHRELNSKHHPHVIRGIAAFKQNGEYYLVLEYADGGNLDDYMRAHGGPQLDHTCADETQQRFRAILRQILGLAEGLKYMHDTKMADQESRRSSVHDDLISPYTSDANNHPESQETFVSGQHNVRVFAPDDLDVEAGSIMPPHGIRINLPDDTTSPEEIPSQQEPIKIIQSNEMLHSPTPPAMHRVHTGLSDPNNPEEQPHWRHGDIKLQNILIGLALKAKTGLLGTWKLADFGRAQMQKAATRNRLGTEREDFRTKRYEPADLYLHTSKISRLFDTWSIGVVIFELVLWIIHGYEFLDKFVDTTCLQFANGPVTGSPYWTMDRNATTARVRDNVTFWFNHILDHDPEREGAIGDLIRLVKNKLLITSLPPDSSVYTPGCRTNAADLVQDLLHIYNKALEDDLYCFSGADRSNVRPLALMPDRVMARGTLSSSALLSPARAVRHGINTRIAHENVYSHNIRDEWIYINDHDFALAYLEAQGFECKDVDLSDELCQNCQKRDWSSPQLIIKRSSLATVDCDMCPLLYEVIQEAEIAEVERCVFNRNSYGYVIDGRETLALKTSTVDLDAHRNDPSLSARYPLGLSRLPQGGSNGHFAFLKACLDSCDTHCECMSGHTTKVLPKRLLDVNCSDKRKRSIKIIETRDLSEADKRTLQYVALSHCWGAESFKVTTKENIRGRKVSLPLADLPQNFRDAIEVTRGLGKKYLWIDSLCILQGPDGDFSEEAAKMETTFSGAYCVIAASSADRASRGFLRPTQNFSDPVRIANKHDHGPDIYVSKGLDDFRSDVLDSPLEGRGWVLQEHALARRTIFFTDKQTYFECGAGIRCQTLTMMQNNSVAFLGHPQFPGAAVNESSSRGAQIYHFTHLFEDYSARGFTHPEDRPVAIDGLMRRMTVAFRDQSLAGVFKRSWGRCLLWRRADCEPSLGNIFAAQRAAGVSRQLNSASPTEIRPNTQQRPAPSWSWMAYKGRIVLINIASEALSWSQDITLPTMYNGKMSWLSFSCSLDKTGIEATVFDFDVSTAADPHDVFLTYDESDNVQNPKGKCIIVGSQRSCITDLELRMEYVIVIRKVADARSDSLAIYERIGVGSIRGKFLVRVGSEKERVLVE